MKIQSFAAGINPFRPKHVVFGAAEPIVEESGALTKAQQYSAQFKQPDGSYMFPFGVRGLRPLPTLTPITAEQHQALQGRADIAGVFRPAEGIEVIGRSEPQVKVGKLKAFIGILQDLFGQDALSQQRIVMHVLPKLVERTSGANAIATQQKVVQWLETVQPKDAYPMEPIPRDSLARAYHTLGKLHLGQEPVTPEAQAESLVAFTKALAAVDQVAHEKSMPDKIEDLYYELGQFPLQTPALDELSWQAMEKVAALREPTDPNDFSDVYSINSAKLRVTMAEIRQRQGRDDLALALLQPFFFAIQQYGALPSELERVMKCVAKHAANLPKLASGAEPTPVSPV